MSRMRSVVDSAGVRAEFVKLRTLSSTWRFLAVTAVVSLAFSGIGVGVTESGQRPGLVDAMTGPAFGQSLMMLLAARTATQEFRTGTIWASYLAVPDWRRLIGAKAVTAVVGSVAVGAVLCAGGLAVAAVVAPRADLAPDTGAEWRTLCGIVLTYAIGAAIGVSVGVLVKSAGLAIALLLVWPFVAEPALGPLADWLLGTGVSPWLPFTAMNAVSGDPTAPPLPGGALTGVLYVTVLAAALLVCATAVQRRRDL
ncbi:hypothetical protein ABT075_33555 [Streptomyces sp. NPDC002677]|uniref:hypothetical protein n=1 Tax=Streptomyces sp. NPDC002677 TaxID=3154774 RepID=UPI0033218F4A